MITCRCPIALGVLLAIAFFPCRFAHAQKTTAWSGAGGDNLWSNAANWTNGVPTDNAADVVNIIGTAGSPFTVNLNGGGAVPNVRQNTINISYAVITNGTLDWDGSAGGLHATNVTFASNASVKRLCPSDTFSNVTYNSEANVMGITGGNGTHSYFGGYIQRTYAWKASPSYGGAIQTIYIDGYGGPANGVHCGTKFTDIGSASADVGQSFFNLNNTRIRFVNGLRVGWDGSSSPAGKATISMTNTYVLLDVKMYLNSNTTMNVTNSILDFRPSAANGGLFNRMTNASLYDGEGLKVWALVENLGMQYEVSGTDTGAVFAGFHDNYSIDQLKFGLQNQLHTSPNIIFTNVYNNDGQPGNEAFYVDLLTPSNNVLASQPNPTFTFNMNGMNLYYKKYVPDPMVPIAVSNGALIQVTGAALIPASPYVHVPEGAKRFSKGDAPLAISAEYGTTYISGFSVGARIDVSLVVTGLQANIDALRTELNGVGSGAEVRLQYVNGAGGTNLFFDWNFSHRSVGVDVLSAELAPGTIFTIY